MLTIFKLLNVFVNSKSTFFVLFFRYFFKTESDEEDCGAVYEEIRDDDAILPCYGKKIICKVKESKHV